MANQTILEQVRTPLATALSSVAGNVYAYVPETVIPPAVVVVPDSPYLEFETIDQTTSDFNSVSLDYMKPRQTVVLISKVDGSECNSGVIEVTQQPVFEEGAGIDLKQLEYIAKGWTESPYRLSTANGVADNRNFITDASTKYDMFALTHDQFSLGGWLEYYHNQATLVAVPTADTVTRNGLAVILDKVTVPQGFDGLTDDAAAANVSTTVVERTTDKTLATDGIA